MQLAVILIGALAWLDLLVLLVMGMTLDRLKDRIASFERMVPVTTGLEFRHSGSSGHGCDDVPVMHAYSINVKQTMRHSRVDSDIAHGVHLGGVGFWQEIHPKKAKASLARHAARKGLRVLGIRLECPITLRPDIWVVEEVREHYMHKGRALVTPTRWVVEVRAHRANQPKLKVAFFATHFISAAWSRNHMMTRKWRRAMWFIHYAKLQRLVAKAHYDGYTSVIGMDANKGIDSMRLHRDQVVVVANRIDGIIVVPAKGVRVQSSGKDVHQGLHTDHAPVSIDIDLLR